MIEVDGATHATEAEQFHDARREAYLRSQSWQILRVTNDAVYDCLDRVLDVIHQRSRRVR